MTLISVLLCSLECSAQMILSEETAEWWLLGKTSHLSLPKATALALASRAQPAQRGTVGFLGQAVFPRVGVSQTGKILKDCLKRQELNKGKKV